MGKVKNPDRLIEIITEVVLLGLMAYAFLSKQITLETLIGLIK